MPEEPIAADQDIQDQLAHLEELTAFLRARDRREQAASAETARLRHTIAAAVDRLEAMLAGQRASRAELQAVIDDLRRAVAPGDHSDP